MRSKYSFWSHSELIDCCIDFWFLSFINVNSYRFVKNSLCQKIQGLLITVGVNGQVLESLNSWLMIIFLLFMILIRKAYKMWDYFIIDLFSDTYNHKRVRHFITLSNWYFKDALSLDSICLKLIGWERTLETTKLKNLELFIYSREVPDSIPSIMFILRPKLTQI